MKRVVFSKDSIIEQKGNKTASRGVQKYYWGQNDYMPKKIVLSK